jgi:hypothetical protein
LELFGAENAEFRGDATDVDGPSIDAEEPFLRARLLTVVAWRELQVPPGTVTGKGALLTI